ncbi:MAG: CBS domain-containing protein [Candidatus Polarisedimenticolaceae bacterium]|nr:CBS domain-containing protein [Candidatus Polarisedimenticolaceae bacterium]
MSGIKRISVRNVMKTDFHTIDGLATIHDALKLIKSERTSVLVVNKRDEHDEFGILLVSDIARHVLAMDRAPKRVNVYEVMAKPAIYVSPDMDIRYCSRLFARYDLVRALVVENSQVIGTVSPNSLVLDGLAELESEA